MRHTIQTSFKMDDGAFTPFRAHVNDAGLDLRAKEATWVPAHDSAIFDTGIHIMIPEGFYGRIESKSGLNVKHSIVSCGGTIDAGYTGSIVVKLYNLSDKDYFIDAGNKIAQLVICPFATLDLYLVSGMEKTERGDNGFGSSGK